jgi:hypothetical protein
MTRARLRRFAIPMVLVLALVHMGCGGGGSASESRGDGAPSASNVHADAAPHGDGGSPLDAGSLDVTMPVDGDSFDGGEPESAAGDAGAEAASEAATEAASEAAAEAIADALVAVETTLAFGPVILHTKMTLPLDLENSGSGSLTVSSAVATGAGYSLDTSALPLVIAAGGKATLQVTFLPKTAGSAAGTLAITSDEGSASVVLSGQGIHAVDLSWTASTSTDVVGYNVYRGTTSGGPYAKINTSLVSGTTYVDATVMGCMTYYYVTTAVDSMGGESAYSAEVTATVPCP